MIVFRQRNNALILVPANEEEGRALGRLVNILHQSQIPLILT